jgi:3-(3-hydroxy-phenyl)propionate hydroxylase
MQKPFVSYFDYRQFAARLPPLGAGREARRHPVAIVGGGPIGLALALGLARHGVASVVVEADDSVCTGSRAGCVSRRTLEIFDQLGAAEPVMRQGLPWDEGWSYHRTTEVFHLKMPADHEAKFPALVNIQQCYVEQYLLDQIERHPELIEVRWQSRVAALADRGDHVALDIATPAGNYAMESAWVVAADGAKSTVRKALDLRMQGTRYDGTYIIVDIRMKSDLPPGRRAWFDPPSNPGATLLLHKHRDDLWRFDYQLRDDEDPQEAVKPENVLARVQSHLELMGETADWQPVWISMYSASCLTLPDYRHGRVLFAGDAAHLVPIFGVRGMNSGIDDTHNLAWKLALVARGLAAEALLASYTAERVFATRVNMKNASKSCEFMAPPSGAFRVMRQAVLGLAATHPWVASLIDPRQATAIGYPESPLNQAAGDAEAATALAPGANLPDAPAGGEHLSRLLGPHFTAFTGTPADAVALENVDTAGAPFRALALDLAGPAATRLSMRPGQVLLARPDGHLLAGWKRCDPARVGRAIRNCLAGVPA